MVRKRMWFEAGDRVRTVRSLESGSKELPRGAIGTVEEELPGVLLKVRFDEHGLWGLEQDDLELVEPEHEPNAGQLRLHKALRDARVSLGPLPGFGARDLSAAEFRMLSDACYVDEGTANQLARVVESLTYAVKEARAEADRNLRVTTRNIGMAIKRGLK